MKNPFEFGRELSSNEIVDREEEISKVISTIHNAGKLFLIGPRRFGKTSILKAASDIAKTENAIIIRLNVEGFPGINYLVQAIVKESASLLKGTVEKVGEQVQNYFSRLRPEVNFNLNQSDWKVTLKTTLDKQPADESQMLLDALDGLEKLAHAQPAKTSIALILDEFQRLIELGGEQIEGQIRASIQQHTRVAYIFAGSKTSLLSDMVMSPARPFYRLGSTIFVGKIPREKFIKFLIERFKAGNFRVTSNTEQKVSQDEVVGKILDAAKDVPYNVQALAHTCWQILTEGEFERALNETIIKKALERVVGQHDPYYTQQWTRLTPVQQEVLLSVIENDGFNLLSQQVVKRIGRVPSTIQRALKTLVAGDILWQDEQLGQIAYRFEDPFFAWWIRVLTASYKFYL